MSANNVPHTFTREWLNEHYPLPRQAPEIDEKLGARLAQGRAVPLMLAPFRDDEVAKVVNECRRIALDYGGSQQLREHLRRYLAPILKGEAAP